MWWLFLGLLLLVKARWWLLTNQRWVFNSAWCYIRKPAVLLLIKEESNASWPIKFLGCIKCTFLKLIKILKSLFSSYNFLARILWSCITATIPGTTLTQSQSQDATGWTPALCRCSLSWSRMCWLRTGRLSVAFRGDGPAQVKIYIVSLSFSVNMCFCMAVVWL